MPVRFMTLDPGHFHAALVQKEMYPNVSPKVDVYAPLGTDLVDHLGRITAYNTRHDPPTSWRVDIHTGPDFVERMLHEHPGHRRRHFRTEPGQDRLHRGVGGRRPDRARYKPWILKSHDLPTLEKPLADADAKDVVAYDIMTERFEVTTQLQRELVNDKRRVGGIVPERRSGPPSTWKASTT